MSINTTQFGRNVLAGTAAITAGTTQTLAGATAITAPVVRVTTGNANDGVILPAKCTAGEEVWVFNLSAVALKVYPQTGGSINSATASDPHTHAASKPGVYRSIGSESWVTVLGA
ncbi:MAG: hypothetical protein WAT23_20150 [Chromatiaceae bacterium]